MYEEKRFSLRNIVLEFLLVILFVFIMIWLFPTKSYMDEKYVTNDELIERLSSLYGRAFADNVESMRDAAKGYFTVERLPQKVGDSVTLTLGEMQEKKLVLEFIDSNGNKCNTTESYVKLTKMETEYQLKVQLTCTDYSDYIVEYIGCYDFCGDCEETTQTTTPTEPTTPTPTVTKKYRYQYKLVTQNAYSDWSAWSAWSTTKVTANELKQVETETRKEISGYNKVYKITGYKTETYTDYENKTKTVADGTTTKLVASVVPAYTTGYYTAWVNAGTTSSTSVLYSTNTVKYTETSTERYLDCNDSCKYVTKRYYTVQKRSWVPGVAVCPTDYKLEGTACNKYETVTNYKTVTEKVAVTKTKQVPVYGYVNGDPIYKTVTYYRYRTRTQTSFASVDYKWSNSKNDTTLIKKGYTLTGYYEQV